MNIKYIDVQFKEGLRDAYVGNVTQWDYGQVLKIQGIELPAVTTVYFSMQQTGGKSIPKLAITSTEGCTYVSVPKQILEQPVSQNYKAYAFVYPSTPEEGRTVGRITMSIKSIPKPEDLNSPEDESLFQQVLEQLNLTLQESKDLAKLAESYAKGGTGTRENEDVDNSKFYAQLAQDYVQNIGIDRDAVEQIKLEVQQLKQAIDLSEQNVRKDAEQVTQDKADITLIAEDVRQNKQSVDLAQADVVKKSEQITKDAQQTAKDVQQTAKDKKAVEDVKTQFVQDVKDATESIKQQTSTSLDAINTKATEQLQAVTDKGTEQVKAVEQAGAQFTQELPKLKQDISSKLDKNLGTENADKVLKVDNEGNVVPVSKTEIAPQGLQEDILKNAVKPIVKGNPIVLKDSQDNKVANLEISGSTSQVQTTGKQLFNMNNRTIVLVDGIKKGSSIKSNLTNRYYISINRWFNDLEFVKKRTSVTLSFKTDNLHYNNACSIVIYGEYSDGKTYYQQTSSYGATTITILVPDTLISCRSIEIRLNNGLGKPFTDTETIFYDIQVEIGSEPTPYEPYSGGQPSPSPEYPQPIVNGECDHITYGNNADKTIKKAFPKIELSEWDRIVKVDGVWKVERNSKTEVYDGSEDEEWKLNKVNDKVDRFETRCNAYKNNLTTFEKHWSNQFLQNVNNGGYELNTCFVYFGKLYFCVEKNKFTLETWKEHIKKNNLTYCGLLETPIYEVLPQETQDALNQIETFYPNSVVQTNEGIEMDINYIADTKLYIDGKFAELQKQLANTQNKLL